jgi:hypothetical protein
MTMSGEETLAVAPEQGPDLVPIGLGQVQGGQLVRGKEGKSTFRMTRGQLEEFGFDFEEEHKPMTLPFVTMLADNASQMQVMWMDGPSQFFLGFTTGTSVRRLADSGAEFAAARAPQAAVGFLGPFHEEDLILLIEYVEQR